jgi:hypothetical protein
MTCGTLAPTGLSLQQVTHAWSDNVHANREQAEH